MFTETGKQAGFKGVSWIFLNIFMLLEGKAKKIYLAISKQTHELKMLFTVEILPAHVLN